MIFVKMAEGTTAASKSWEGLAACKNDCKYGIIFEWQQGARNHKGKHSGVEQLLIVCIIRVVRSTAGLAGDGDMGFLNNSNEEPRTKGTGIVRSPVELHPPFHLGKRDINYLVSHANSDIAFAGMS